MRYVPREPAERELACKSVAVGGSGIEDIVEK